MWKDFYCLSSRLNWDIDTWGSRVLPRRGWWESNVSSNATGRANRMWVTSSLKSLSFVLCKRRRRSRRRRKELQNPTSGNVVISHNNYPRRFRSGSRSDGTWEPAADCSRRYSVCQRRTSPDDGGWQPSTSLRSSLSVHNSNSISLSLPHPHDPGWSARVTAPAAVIKHSSMSAASPPPVLVYLLSTQTTRILWTRWHRGLCSKKNNLCLWNETVPVHAE